MTYCENVETTGEMWNEFELMFFLSRERFSMFRNFEKIVLAYDFIVWSIFQDLHSADSYGNDYISMVKWWVDILKKNNETIIIICNKISEFQIDADCVCVCACEMVTTMDD